jgi:hypothetical protein
MVLGWLAEGVATITDGWEEVTGGPGGGAETTCDSGPEAQPPMKAAKPHSARASEEREGMGNKVFITQLADTQSASEFSGNFPRQFSYR